MKKILLPLFAVALMLAACDEEQLVSSQLQKGVTFTVPDFVDESGTRVDVSVDNSGAHFTWTAGDTLGVFPGNGYQTAFPISAGAGTSTAVFDGADWALRPNASYAAYYPFVPSMQLDKSKIEASYLGQTQNGNGSTAHLGDYDYLAAKYTTVSASGDVNFTLNHLGCLVRFQLTMPEADTYTSMTLSCDGVNFATSNKFDLTAETPALSAKSTSESISLALTNVATTEANQVLTLYMMLPPMDLSSKNLTVKVIGETYYEAKVAGKNMAAGSIYGYSNTMVAPLMHNGHAYVDLGITDDNGNPIYWATCNLGASSPEEYGNYYAWGETEQQASNTYDWSTYFDTTDGGSTFAKYNNNGGKTVLESADDAATANWGGNWRMPTYAELDKLRNNCTWTWTTQNCKNGYKVTGSNGNSIFLPAAGCRYYSSLNNDGSYGDYWSSSLSSSNSGYSGGACILFFRSGLVSSRGYSGRRYCGFSVRPVYSPNDVKATSISLSNSTLSLQVGGSASTLTASILPSNVSSSNIRWVSSNTNIATVSDGVVTPVAAGSCYITAITMDGTNLNASCYVRVKSATLNANGHEYVDLGITDDSGNPIYWATCNLGASSPEEYGNYYAWGETKAYGEEDTSNATNYSYTSGQGSPTYTKTYYNWSTYKYCKGSYDTQTKYCNYSNYGTVDNKIVLESADDAATANWGGSWRMPTDAELTKLRTKCTWTLTTQNGKDGYTVTGSNGNSIFLPFAGFRDDSSLGNDGSYGDYWSSSLLESNPYNSWYAYELSIFWNYVDRDRYCRIVGFSVRPVCQ